MGKGLPGEHLLPLAFVLLISEAMSTCMCVRGEKEPAALLPLLLFTPGSWLCWACLNALAARRDQAVPFLPHSST